MGTILGLNFPCSVIFIMFRDLYLYLMILYDLYLVLSCLLHLCFCSAKKQTKNNDKSENLTMAKKTMTKVRTLQWQKKTKKNDKSENLTMAKNKTKNNDK